MTADQNLLGIAPYPGLRREDTVSPQPSAASNSHHRDHHHHHRDHHHRDYQQQQQHTPFTELAMQYGSGNIRRGGSLLFQSFQSNQVSYMIQKSLIKVFF